VTPLALPWTPLKGAPPGPRDPEAATVVQCLGPASTLNMAWRRESRFSLLWRTRRTRDYRHLRPCTSSTFSGRSNSRNGLHYTWPANACFPSSRSL